MPPPKLPSRTCTIRLIDVVRDDRLRFREPAYRSISPVDEYAEAMRGDPDATGYAGPSWGEFPRIVCIDLTEPFTWTQDTPPQGSLDKTRTEKREYPAGTTLLIGGFTRCEAADEVGITHAPAVVYSGTWNDALSLAWPENTRKQHGVVRSDRATELVLWSIHLHHPGLSERDTAKIAGCSKATVHRFRAAIAERDAARERSEQYAASERAATSPPPPPVVAPSPPTSPPPPATPTHTPGEIVPVDAWKRPLPPGVVTAFECVGPMAKVVRSIEDAVKEMMRLKHGADGWADKCLAPGMVKVETMDAYAAFTTGLDLIRFHVPFLVCPECEPAGSGKVNGKQCKLCRGLGWVGKAQADAFTPTQEKTASKFRGTN